MKRQSHGHSIAQLEVLDDPPPPAPRDALVAERTEYLLDSPEDRQLYGLSKETVEPVFVVFTRTIPGP